MALVNVIDLVIAIGLGVYLIDGYRRGFILLALELLGTVLTFYLAFQGAEPLGKVIGSYFPLNNNLDRLAGFLSLWLIIQIIIVGLTNTIYLTIPDRIKNLWINRFAGIFPSMAKGLIIIAIALTLISILQINHEIKPAILNSTFGQPIVSTTQTIEQKFLQKHGQKLIETFTFLTNNPLNRTITNPDEIISLPFKTTDIKVDQESERAMLKLINQERQAIGLHTLTDNVKLTNVARNHAKDMLARGYFGHSTPEGIDPFNRMREGGVNYLTAGENLALAPIVELAHRGLMNSPGHRANILESDFYKVGIGVIETRFYGKIFVQEFTD